MKWWHAVIGVLLLAVGYGVYRVVTVPAPGVRMEDQGQQHVIPQEVASFIYNSNPPTSGPHLPTWVKPGIYTVPQSEGELIHSLEHGYVVISYNCTVHLRSSVIPAPLQPHLPRTRYGAGSSLLKEWIPGQARNDTLVRQVFAHEEETSPSAEMNDPAIATGSAVNETDVCKTFITQLTELAQRKKLFKLIVVPRPQLDTTIALTAWTYLDKFDQFDAGRIERFIDFHRDHGPEKTME